MLNQENIRTDDLFAPISFGGGGEGGGGASRSYSRSGGAIRGVLNDIAENHPSYNSPEVDDLAGNFEANVAGHPDGDAYSGYVGGDWDGR